MRRCPIRAAAFARQHTKESTALSCRESVQSSLVLNIIIDRDKLYHLGHSIKDIGKKISTISESDKELIKELLIHLN